MLKVLKLIGALTAKWRSIDVVCWFCKEDATQKSMSPISTELKFHVIEKGSMWLANHSIEIVACVHKALDSHFQKHSNVKNSLTANQQATLVNQKR
jgi:hypothetical protein